ncbi:unnamed protein product, partial [marine sediment metagenome]
SATGFHAIDDLCRMAAQRDGQLKRFTENGSVTIVACFPRAVEWLFHAAGAPLPEENVSILNMRTQSPESIIEKLLDSAAPAGKPNEQTHLEKQGEWIPWFPVIDYQRCQDCMQCLNFCLFGVYSLEDDGRVHVTKPANCKTRCPACARVCPHAAIIFPKYDKSPINGDEVNEDDLGEETIKANLSEILGPDIHKLLRNRGKAHKRFAKDADPRQLSRQRLKRLISLKDKLDIPEEVIASLSGQTATQTQPSPQDQPCPNTDECQFDCNQKPEKDQGD